MSEEPNRKMEELLRAYAKQRREQAEPPMQMHPATRKLLQDEVKRTLVASEPAPGRSWRSFRWPLAAMGVGFAALMVMFAMLNTQMRNLLPAMSPTEHVMTQAKSAKSEPGPVAERTATPAPLVAANEDKVAQLKKSPATPPGSPPAAAESPIASAAPVTPPQTPATSSLLDSAASGQAAGGAASFGDVASRIGCFRAADICGRGNDARSRQSSVSHRRGRGAGWKFRASLQPGHRPGAAVLAVKHFIGVPGATFWPGCAHCRCRRLGVCRARAE